MSPRRVLAAVIALVTATALLTACGPRDDPGQPGTGTIEVGGVQRSYLLHVPTDLADDPALVVMLHGGLGSAAQAQRSYGWNVAADAAGFVVAYPDGDGRTWNAGDCCGAAAREQHDDVAFLSALVETLQDEFGVDPSRTFATGMSNGAMMAYRLACETDLFAAVAPVAGTIVTSCDSPQAVSLLHVHGMIDTSVPFDGSPGDGVGNVDGMPVPAAVDIFRTAGDCAAPVVTAESSITTSASACSDGVVVSLVTVAGADHSWPEGTTARVTRFFGL